MMNRLGGCLIGLFAVCMLTVTLADSQSTASSDARRYSQDELDQLLAPIALYPDQLLAQVLMAATYPLEVVEAARFVQQNPALSGDALDQALAEHAWDPSVQSLAAFPQVLAMMNDALGWMQRLGDAFLTDQWGVMETVQALRRRAEAEGNLQSTTQQTVIPQDNELVIAPAQPDVIYVPVYDPTTIYGPWWAPDFPPLFWYPSPIYGYPVGPAFVTGIAFGHGWSVSRHHWGWARPDWHGHHIAVDGTNNRFWNRPGRPAVPPGNWQHSPEHRRGVAYPDSANRNRFVRVDPGAVQARENFRGRDLATPAPTGAPARSGLPPPATMHAPTSALPLAPAQSAPNVAPMARERAPVATAAVPFQPSSRMSLPTQPVPRSYVRPPAPIFDPGISRQQAQVNAQRGQESRQSVPALPPAFSRTPAPPAGGHVAAPARPR